MTELVHYRETQQEKRERLNSTGNFRESAICGNGNAHAQLTRQSKQITCKACLYNMGLYSFPVPPVSTHLWDRWGWINFIDAHGKWG